MNSSRVDLDTQISKILSKSLPKNRGLYSEMVQVILILSFLIGNIILIQINFVE